MRLTSVLILAAIIASGVLVPVPVSAQPQTQLEVRPVYRVLPDYPIHGAGREGLVELEFTVTENGRVKNIEVIHSQPEGVFDAAAAEALSLWIFSPVVFDGNPIEVDGIKERFRFVPPES